MFAWAFADSGLAVLLALHPSPAAPPPPLPPASWTHAHAGPWTNAPTTFRLASFGEGGFPQPRANLPPLGSLVKARQHRSPPTLHVHLRAPSPLTPSNLYFKELSENKWCGGGLRRGAWRAGCRARP